MSPRFDNFFIINNSSSEKLVIHHDIGSGTAGAGNAPERNELVWKWTNTSNQLDVFQVLSNGSPKVLAGSIIKVWGSD